MSSKTRKAVADSVVEIKGVSPEIAADLEKLYAKHGKLTVAAVVRRARTLETKMGEASPYHGHFTWDAQQALDELHDHQARKLVASVRIEVTEGDMVDVRAYISTPDGDRRAYRSAEHVARTPELLAAYTEQMEAQMEQLVERMRRFQQFAVIVSAWDTYKKGA